GEGRDAHRTAKREATHAVKHAREVAARAAQRLEEREHAGLAHRARRHDVLATRHPCQIAVAGAAAAPADTAATGKAATAGHRVGAGCAADVLAEPEQFRQPPD